MPEMAKITRNEELLNQKRKLMGIKDKIIKWLNDIGKEKCSQCKSVDIEEIGKEFIKTKTVTRTSSSFGMRDIDDGSLRGSMSSDTECYEEEINVYNLKFKCNNCNHSWDEKFQREKRFDEEK
jgi:transposase-like protein